MEKTSAHYMRVVKMTDEETIKMYMTKCKKIELARMLLEANKLINLLTNN